MAYKVKFPDGNQIVVNSLSEKIEYLCHKEYYEPFLVKGKISDNIETWNVSIYKENNFIKIDLPLKPESLTVKVNFVDDKGNPLSGMGKFAKVVPSGREKLVGETLFATFIGEAIKLIDQTKITITDDTYEVASVKYILERKELLVIVKKIVLGSMRIVDRNIQYDGTMFDMDLRPSKSDKQTKVEKINIPHQVNKLRAGNYTLTITSNQYKTYTTTFDIKAEGIIEVPIILTPTLKYKVTKSLKDNKKSVLAIFCMAMVMVLLLVLQSHKNSEETNSLVSDYTDKISQIENEKSTLIDSVLLLKATLEVDSNKTANQRIQDIKSKIDVSVNRIMESKYTYADIREIEKYKRWPILFVDSRVMNNISSTCLSSEQDTNGTSNRASTYREIQEEVERLIANAKEKLTELNKKHSSSKESNFDDNFYSRKRKNVEKLRDENFSKIQER